MTTLRGQWIAGISWQRTLVATGQLPSTLIALRSNGLVPVCTFNLSRHLATLPVEAIMHEIQIGKHAVQVNNWQFCTLFFFCVSGIGFMACAFLVLLDIIRWSMQ